MTTLNPASLPSQINTVEEMVAWGTAVLSDLYPDLTVVESAGTANRRALSTPLQVTSNPSSSWVVINRLTLDLAPTWRRQGKLWLAVQPMGNLTIPSEYLQP